MGGENQWFSREVPLPSFAGPKNLLLGNPSMTEFDAIHINSFEIMPCMLK